MRRYLMIFLPLFSFLFFSANADTMDNIKISDTANANDDAVVKQYKDTNPMGMSVAIDIYDCDVAMMKDEKVIRQFIKDLVKFIGMKTYAEPLIKDFGPTPRLSGISALQLIETSDVTMHFLPYSKSAYIDIFSCSAYRPNAAAEFCKNYFKASKVTLSSVNFRQ